MKTRNSEAQRVEERNLSPEPESMQKYSDEARERIAKKAYELYEQRGATGGARPGRLAESRGTGSQGDE